MIEELILAALEAVRIRHEDRLKRNRRGLYTSYRSKLHPRLDCSLCDSTRMLFAQKQVTCVLRKGVAMASPEKVSKGIRMLESQGHLVTTHMKLAKLYWEIDCRVWATSEEIECLADSNYSFSEFEEVYIKRRA